MTLLTVIQGKNCALVTSDLLFRYCDEDQMQLPRDLRTYQSMPIPTKWRENMYGDYIAWHGAMTPQENAAFERASLKKLMRNGLQAEHTRADVVDSVIFYAQRSSAQIYHGYTQKNVTLLSVGKFSFAGIQPQLLQEFGTKIAKGLHLNSAVNSQALRNMSTVIEQLYLEYEQDDPSFGGFVSHLIFPNRFETLAYNEGKLGNHPQFPHDPFK